MNRPMDGFHQQEVVAATPVRLRPAGDGQAAARQDSPEEQLLQGTALSPGLGFGRACFYRTPTVSERVTGAALNEVERLRRTLPRISDYLDKLAQNTDARLNRAAGDIFRAQRMLIEDPALIATLENALCEADGSAESAIRLTFDRLVDELRAAGTAAIRERADDFTELKDLICSYLGRDQAYVYCQDVPWCRPGECQNGCDHILIATRLIPGTTIGADSHTMGFVVENGGPSSHAAILARMMGLPAVSGIPNPESTIPVGSQILVDGDTGRVYINPSLETLAHYHGRQTGCAAVVETTAEPVQGLRILADLERLEDIHTALAAQAEGIGLYRSETEPMIRQRFLTEDEQFERYSGLLDAFPDSPICVRLLDLGADKAADWLQLPPEDNPALGCRGARLLLAQPDILATQARALARASQKRALQVLYPMVHSLDQFLQLRALFDSAISDISNARLSHGVMFEVPSACIEARAFFDRIDFGRIGTNDLTQYLFAADRTSSTIDQHELFEQPALWALIEEIARTATAAGKPLSICGELAADPKYTGRILQAGISEISVCPRRIAALRLAVA